MTFTSASYLRTVYKLMPGWEIKARATISGHV